jgi:hypothetical protein
MVRTHDRILLMRPFLILSVGVGVAGLLLWRLHHRRTSPKRPLPTVDSHTENPSIVVEVHAPTSLMETQWRALESARADYRGHAHNTQVEEGESVDNWIEQLPDVEPEAVQASKANTEPSDETATVIPQSLFTETPATLDANEGLGGPSFEDQSTLPASDELSEPVERTEIESQHLPQPVLGNGLAKGHEDFGMTVEDNLTESDSSGIQVALVSAPVAPPVDDPQVESVALGTIATEVNASSLNLDSIDPNAEVTISEGSQPEDLDGATRAPSRYRPPQQRPARAPVTTPNTQSQRSNPGDILLRVKVRLTFDHQGFCQIGFLPERSPDLDDEVLVKLQGDSLRLVAQEDWYQDIRLDNPGEFLRNSLELKGRIADARRIRWLLTGRDLYVLANHARASGFISTDRLVLGRTHVVLCIIELLAEVEALLSVAGCAEYVKLDDTYGVPHGWVALRNVSPTKAIELEPGIDPFYPIKPAADVDIELTGGICLRNSVWLSEYAPRVHIVGEFDESIKVRIDGKEAHPEPDGSFVVDGYDKVGSHSVYCEGLSCSSSYSIEEPPDSWEEWDAYGFGATYICGPRIRRAPGAKPELLCVVPITNLLLLGAKPGQVFRCTPRRVKRWKGFVPFEVVWALPSEPLRCDKRVALILDYNPIPVAAGDHTGLVFEWTKAILDASRKGLGLSHENSDVAQRWKEYKKVAREIWKANR